MTLQQYWTIVAKQWKLILICCLIGGIGAFIGSKLATPLYQSTAFVQVHAGDNSGSNSGNNQTTYASLLADSQLVQTELALALSAPVLSEVASHYPGLTIEQLAKEVTVRAQPNTSLFAINVLDASPTRAAALANDVATTLIKQQTEVAKQDNAQSQQQLQQDLLQRQQQISDITSRIAALQATNGKQAEISALSAQVNVLQQHSDEVQLALVQLAAQNLNFLLLAQPAQTASGPTLPIVRLNTAGGLLAGLLLGILLAVGLELFDTRVRTLEALVQLLDWPVLATMWRVHSSKNKELVDLSGQSADVEAYCTLRTNIGFSAIDNPLHSLVVTSAVLGKSSIAANLAIFMARSGKNTILVDADLRHPALHEKFHLPADSMGLSNALLAFSQLGAGGTIQQSSTQLPSEPSLDPYLHAVDTPNLRVMPSGPLPPNPPELLHSKAMERLLFTAMTNYGTEMVIFDTPPALGLPDVSMLAPKVDGTVVVIDIAHANKKNLKQVKALLTQAEAHVLGCVVSEQRHSRKDSAYSSSYAEVADLGVQNETVASGATVEGR